MGGKPQRLQARHLQACEFRLPRFRHLDARRVARHLHRGGQSFRWVDSKDAAS